MAVTIEISPAQAAGHVPHRGSEASGLVGRTAELVALCDLLAAARDGRSGVLLISGEAGIGKSVLLDYVEARAGGFHTARFVGVESEMELPYFGDLRGLPPMLVQAGSHEILLSDAVRLAAKAAGDDGATTLDVTPGVPHVFQGYAAMLDEGDAALNRAAEFLKRHLSVTSGS
jgi:acetyl esterase/lipase